MNQNLIKGLLCMAVAGTLGACSDGFGTGFDSADAKGKITLIASLDCSLQNSASRAEYNEVTADDLSLRLIAPDGSSQSWDRVSDFPTNQLFNVGTYTLEAFYGDEATEGFEAPYFFGSAQFKVEENETTPVSIKAVLNNALLDVDYTDNFKNYMADWSAEVHSAGGSYFEYVSTETKPIYTRAGEVEVNVDFTKPNGKQAKLTAASFTAEPQHFYHVKIDVSNTDGSGDAFLNVTFDDGVTEQTVDIDISDDVMNAPAPVVTPVGFTPGTPIELVAGVVPDDALGFEVIANGGLKDITLTTQSATLLEQGWPAEVNLIGSDLSALTDFGFEAIGVTKPDKMAVITLTKVLSHINYIAGVDNTTEFALQVRDKYGKVSDAVAITIVTAPLSLDLANGSYYAGDDYVEFTLSYNGNNPSEDVTVQYQNSRGTWSTLAPVYEGVSKGVYSATAKITPSNSDINLQASVKADASLKASLTIQAKPQLVADSKAAPNAFTTFAYIPVVVAGPSADSDMLAQLMNGSKVYVSADGSDFVEKSAEADVNNSLLKISGLENGVNYSVKIVNPSKTVETSPVFSVVTETAAQLPNDMGKLESLDGWGTNNTMTTSSGNLLGSATSKLEGTTSVNNNNAFSGKGALVRTVGWGSENSSLSTRSCQYRDPGLLHLGDERRSRPNSDANGPVNTDDLNCGIAFSSRPASVTFQYKYTAKNSSDKGQALVQVFDSANNLIAESMADLPAQSSFSAVTLNLSDQYDFKSAKASKIYIRFLSTSNSSFLDFNSTNFSSNLISGHVGSQLYIDEVVLNY